MKKVFVWALGLLCALFADNFVDPNPQIRVDQTLPIPREPLPVIEDIEAQPAQAGDPVISVIKQEFWVQMGAFSNVESAKSIETRLKARGLNARLFASNDLNRVAVGPYASRSQAERSLESLKAIEAEAFLTTPEHLQR
ncbi:MAG: SPOR domain-containing protein [Helicobacteraceae bacterium]|jgi:cell division protein FtsN|nr:SPOR domain-containing protein [Helicobacteraceae bacterium]